TAWESTKGMGSTRATSVTARLPASTPATSTIATSERLKILCHSSGGCVSILGSALAQAERWLSVRNVTCLRGYARGERATISAIVGNAVEMAAVVCVGLIFFSSAITFSG